MVAVLPPAPGRDHETDLLPWGHHYLLWGHNYRASRDALKAGGATVLAEGGQPVTA